MPGKDMVIAMAAVLLCAAIIVVVQYAVLTLPKTTTVYIDHWYLDNGSICHEVGDPNSQIGTALTCEKLTIK